MTKARAREQLVAARRAMAPEARDQAADAIALHALSVPVIARARRVACYLSMPSEPGTGPLVAGLTERGIEVLVPISLPDHTLDWTAYAPGQPMITTVLGIPEPTGERLGADAVASCDVVVLPALAVDHAGHRLGRGAGYYDRALAGVGAPLCALVFSHEVLPKVPHEPHDVPVQMVITPDGLFRVP